MARRTVSRKTHFFANDLGNAPDVVPPSAMAEMGITGTANWGGHIYAETNRKLQWLLAYGVPGSRWGVWENLERTNGYITAALESVAAPIRDALVEVEPADTALVPDAQKHADFVKWNLLEGPLEPRWPTFLEQLTTRPLMYGFGIWEPIFGLGEHPLLPGGRGMVLRKLAERLPVSVDVNGWKEANGDLASITQRGPRDGRWVTVDLPADRVLLHSWKRTGNNFAGYSVFRTVEYACRIMDHLLRLTGVSMVREAAGVPYAEALNEKVKTLSDMASAKLWKQLANLVYHENAAMVMPPGWSLKWFTSAGRDKSSVIKAYHDLGKLILFQTKSQELALGLSETGSRSVGEVHAKTSEEFAQGVLAEQEATLNGVGARAYTGLPRRMVDANFGPQKAYPTLRIVLKRSKLEPESRANAIATYVGAGMITPTVDDENAAREDVGLTPIDDATRDAAIAKAAAAKTAAAVVGAPGTPPAPGAPRPGAQPGVVPKPPPAPPPAGSKAKRQLAAFTPKRELRPSEQRVDFAAIDSYLNRARDDFELQARPLVTAMVVKALPGVRRVMESGNAGDVGQLPLDTSDLERFVSRFLDESRSQGHRQVRAEYSKGTTEKVRDERAAGDQAHAPAPVRMAAEEEGKEDDTEAASDATEQLDAMQSHLVRRMRNRASADLELAAIDESRTGGDPDDVVRTVLSDLLDTGALRADAGLVLTKAFNVGREQFAQEHGDDVESVEVSGLLDKNICDPCENLDGETYDFNSDEHLEHVPPLKECDGGDQCRCILTYNFKSDAGDAGGSEDGDAPVDEPSSDDDE